VGKSVLVIDDEELIRRSLRLALESAGDEVTALGSGREARALLAEQTPDCAIFDLRLRDADGLDLLRGSRARDPRLPVLMITAHGDVDNAIAALRLGAFDFIRKPFEIEEVLAAVANALRTGVLERRVAYLEQQAQGREDTLVHGSEVMRAVLERVERVATQPVPVVLVTGESGTGKELIARALHRRSSRASGPFVELNCSALPEQLVVSELFGHERGAFSDARERKLGLVELADGGTLFLDEIGDLAKAAQAKLLKFVETTEYRRVGGTKTLKVDCRIVAATHRDLATDENFRRDLYFRMAGVSIALPPLRERGEDVMLLARRFLQQFARDYRKPALHFSAAAEALLTGHRWPGNVRELKSAVAQAVLHAEGGEVGRERLSVLAAPTTPDAPALPQHAEDVQPLVAIELGYLRHVLALCGGNKQLAAERLGISRHTLARRLEDGDRS
jgi:two-component system response regulator AtoC